MRLALPSSRLIILALLALVLTACGGGGTGSPLDGAAGGGDSTEDPVDTTGDSSDTSGLAMSLALLDDASGAATSTINSVEPGRLVATLTTSGGTAVPNAIITFTVLNGDPDLTPSSGEILTDSAGQASIIVGTGTSEAGAAISLQAVVADLTTSIQFSVGSASIDIGRDPDGDYSSISAATFVTDELDVDAMGGNTFDVSATGTTTLRIGVIDSGTGALFTTPLTANFVSNCDAADLDTGVTTVNGIASSTFESDPSCEGDVTVTASLVEIAGATAVGTITVAGSTANSIEFESSTPTSIAIKGTGGVGRQETSELVFQVVDDGGLPKAGETVSFALSTTLGGISLTESSAISNAQGEVTAIVSSGTVPTPVQVIATLTLDNGTPADTSDDVDVSTVSDTLVISTGLPNQDAFSVSASILNPGGGNVLDDNVVSTITVRAADAFNNPAPDGTPVNFVTEYGDIGPSCTTIDGSCSVTWTSSAPRSVQLASTGEMKNLEDTACDYDQNGVSEHQSANLPCPTHLFDYPLGTVAAEEGQIRSGRTTILAYALGDESFVDSNGNGFYDYVDANGNGSYDAGEEEPFVDLPEAFRDDNEDGVFGNSFAAFDNGGDGACISDDGRDQCDGWLTGGVEEEFVDLDVDGLYDGDNDGDTANGQIGNGIFNGVLCDEDLEALGVCTSELVNVRAQVVLVMSDNTPIVDWRNSDAARSPLPSGGVIDVSAGAESVYIALSDINNNLPVLGTTVEVEVENCSVGGGISFEIGNTNDPGIFMAQLQFFEDDSTGITAGTVTVTAETTTEFSNGDAKIFRTTDTFTCVDAT